MSSARARSGVLAALRGARRRAAQERRLRVIGRVDHPQARSLATALRHAVRERVSASEEQAIAVLEQRRVQMLESTQLLHTPGSDWSGDPDDERFLEEQVGEITRGASKDRASALLLFSLVRAWRPRAALELGTCVGISCAYQASALRLNGDGGRLWSCEASSARIGVARTVVAELGLGEVVELVWGRFQETLAPTLAGLPAPLDYAFVDGHHDEDATWAYFEQILPAASAEAVLVFDDIHWSEGMEAVWARIARDARVALAVDVGDMGICLLGRGSGPLIALPR